MTSKKGQGFGHFWAGIAAALVASVALTGYLLWRLDALWPMGLMAVAAVGIGLFLWHGLRRMDVRHQATLEALADRSQALEMQMLRLSAVHKVASALSEAVELPELLGDGLERAVCALGLDGGHVHLKVDGEDEVMRLSALFGANSHFWDGESTIRVGECICGQVAAEGSPVVVEDAASDPRVAGRACAAGAVPSVASVPLKSKGRTLGVLTVRSCDPHHFALQDVELLTSIANFMGAALENARIRAEMRDQIDELTAEVRQAAIVQERHRISREMHDGLAQTLGLLNLQIEMVKIAAKAGNWAAAEDELAQLDSYLSGAYTDVREALSDLRSATLQGETFLSSLRDYVAEFGRRNDLEAVFLTDNGDEPVCLPALVEVHLQRVVQEALTNVRRHAAASRVEVRVGAHPKGWEVKVIDDGVGFDADQPAAAGQGGYGLLTMRERIEGVGGCFAVDSKPGTGTRIAITVPCNSQDRN
jgi:two-component system nitrate/nitrite sensor histidine kinase NarX